MDENASRDVKQIIYEVYATADALGKKEGVSLSLMQLRPLRIRIPLEPLGESFDRNQELEADLDELRMLRQSDRYQVYKLRGVDEAWLSETFNRIYVVERLYAARDRQRARYYDPCRPIKHR